MKNSSSPSSQYTDLNCCFFNSASIFSKIISYFSVQNQSIIFLARFSKLVQQNPKISFNLTLKKSNIVLIKTSNDGKYKLSFCCKFADYHESGKKDKQHKQKHYNWCFGSCTFRNMGLFPL